MFNKLLRSIGIGSAKVDTVLANRTCVPGGTLEGEVRIYGGNAAQDIETIYLTLMTDYEVEVDDTKVRRTVDLGRFHLTDRFTVQAEQELVMPFSITVPLTTPVTMGKSTAWVQTGLDIKSALDPQDRDALDVRPHPLVEAFLGSAERLGFRLYKVDTEAARLRHSGTLPFVQEFEFKPAGGEFRGKLDELEAIFQLSETGVLVTLQIDRRARDLGSFFAEAAGLDESYASFSYGPADLDNLDNLLASVIRKYC